MTVNINGARVITQVPVPPTSQLVVQAATEQAEIATTKASEASSSAATATAQAVIATEKAVLTAADRVQTALDVIATNADAVATAADRVQTGLDRVQTGLDVIATNADVVLTGLDVIATEAARDAALIQAGVYTTEALGRAAVADGQAFKVQGSGDVAAYEYRRTNSTTSVLIATYPSSAAVSVLDAFKNSIDANAIEFVYTKNLYNPAVKKTNKNIDSATGNLTTASGWGTSDYIPVTAGQAYTISANATKRLGLSFFTSSSTTTAISGSYNGTASLPLTVTAPVGATHMIMNVYSTVITEPTQIQVEAGSSATAYEAWFNTKRLVGRANLTDAVRAELDTINKAYEVDVTNPNLLDLTLVKAGKLIDSATGNLTTATGWGTSGYIPVTAGQSYTISGTRGRQGLSFFTSNSTTTAISGSYNGTTTLPLTVTAPVGATHMIINLYSTTVTTYSNMQVEAGTSATNYAPYGTYKYLSKSYVSGGLKELNTQSMLVLDSAGESFIQCVIAGDDSQIIKHSIVPFATRNLSTSEVFNFYHDFLDGVLFKAGTDDVAPYRVMSATVGANHGYIKTNCTVTGHTKTALDVGSVWTDGANEWVIIETATNIISITARTINTAFVSGTLTHVSGATNTASFTPSAVSSLGWFPVIKNRILKCSVDGQTLATLDGTFYYSDNASFHESYEIMNKSSIVEWLITQVGLSPTPADYDGTSDLSVSVSYVFDVNGNCTIYTDFLALNAVSAFQDIMFIQCQKMQTGFGNIYYYIPNSLALTHESNPYNFSLKQDMTSFASASRIDFTLARCEATKQLCDRVIQLNDNIGMAVGYLPVLDAASGVRRTNASNKALQISEVAKIYMSAIDGLQSTLAAGDYFSVVAYRNFYKKSATRTSSYVVKKGNEYYWFMDWHSTVKDRVPAPNFCVGKSFTVVDSYNAAVLSDSITNSVVVDVTASGSYGYVILKVV